MLLPQHEDLGNEGRTSLESSEHQLNTKTLGSVSRDTGEFLINRIIIKDLGKKKVTLSTSRKACIGVADCDSENASHFVKPTSMVQVIAKRRGRDKVRACGLKTSPEDQLFLIHRGWQSPKNVLNSFETETETLTG